MISKSLSFGIQNYFFVKSNETAVNYNYYGYVEKKGSVLIMRTDKTASEAKYFVSAADFDTEWAARAGKTYVYPSSLVDPTV